MDQSLHRSRRLGVADIAAVYGTEAVHRRIAQLRACGQHYAAVAIEREIHSATTEDGAE
ncbi:hypothetical protein SAMN04244553_0652 [Nocardia amikacinitolerans]|uniref:Uncharacterized protein n=1 Tax=Nocardia amikacinitolerans TaxID=756689 RepID=A0A285KU57_9NOCA|nr:hypothetical protein [Nocardia amikacinitolerans]MCP2275822.1 hypothetical protein [Nocardia amikacinitolerans]MCP2294094.1 hypothetical protein [Nocardia amikacinitolerans]SNY76155.1 hypothetical protein SAMN04244553_0652 [Nocardia amikacinitolerans]